MCPQEAKIFLLDDNPDYAETAIEKRDFHVRGTTIQGKAQQT